jgi:hypothetical protein
VQGHRLPPLFGRDFVDAAEARPACIVHQHVQPAEMSRRLLDCFLAILRPGHIQADHQDLPSSRFDSRLRLPRLFPQFAGADGDLGSTTGQVDGNSRPDPHRSPRHQGDFSFQIHGFPFELVLL